MIFRNRLITFISLLSLSIILMSWGYNGHYKINAGASLSFTSEMEQFMNWTTILAEHASDADERKKQIRKKDQGIISISITIPVLPLTGEFRKRMIPWLLCMACLL